MKTINFNPLTLYQTQVCKGLAILFIVIHNFLSKFDPQFMFNEFDFDSQRIIQAIGIIQSDPSDFIRVFMTFLGHYGVQVFIFLSAYGLVRSIETQPTTWSAFMIKRIKQLYIPMLFVMTFYLILNEYYDGIFNVRTGAHDYVHVLKRMLFIANFYPDEAFLVIGPWWFLSLIVQFYCIFLPMRKMQVSFGNKSLGILSVIAILFSIPLLPWLKAEYNINLSVTVLGHLPEFALGMYVASLEKIKVPLWLIGLSLMGLILGNLYSVFWYFTPLCAIVVIMSLCGILIKYIPNSHPIHRLLNYMGVLSVYIFLLNGVIREPFVILLTVKGYEISMAFIYTAIVTALCIFFAYLFYTLDNAIQKQYIKS